MNGGNEGFDGIEKSCVQTKWGSGEYMYLERFRGIRSWSEQRESISLDGAEGYEPKRVGLVGPCGSALNAPVTILFCLLHFPYQKLDKLFLSWLLYRCWKNFLAPLTLIEREVTKDVRVLREFRRFPGELRASIEGMEGYVCELKVLKSCVDVIEAVKVLEHTQLDETEKATRLMLMVKEPQLKVHEKTNFMLMGHMVV
ncbi:hypothetical protein Tco_0871020 [Tanacetum coccineum]